MFPLKPSFHAGTLLVARQYAESGRIDDLFSHCTQVSASRNQDLTLQLDLGVLLSNYGFLTEARRYFERALVIEPNDLRAEVNLSNLYHQLGEHGEVRYRYTDLIRKLPNNPSIRRNWLTMLQYDPDATDAELLVQARAWGEWAITRAGGPCPRPPITSLKNRPLRIGYVSADLCQHTVGLFVKNVLSAHDVNKVRVFAYSSGQVEDWVTDEIRVACTLRMVGALDEVALVRQIREDGIDVLVDLSGHTAGSRLTAFAHRPAPVMVSWLGYFATTGLPIIDAVLLDEWHAPAGMEAQYVEPIVRLPGGRLCYQPAPWAPDSLPGPAFERKGHITFGCFNNTAKLNAQVFDMWARVLHAVPDAHLILKWRTFNDQAFRKQVTDAFNLRGISGSRIELRGPSVHTDLLKEYADIDIALDTFPFTGGLTSCEALWMGVPVVTWPHGRVVSRQTHAILGQIGLEELSATDGESYVQIATELANDHARLANLRSMLRERMSRSTLMNVAGFTRQLEDALIELYRRIEANEGPQTVPRKTILHVGPGHRSNGAKLPAPFQVSEWQEIRLDIDPNNEPDIVGSMVDMGSVQSASVDAVYSAHNIEHVYAHEVTSVLREFLRVLKPNGFLLVTCPDLQTLGQLLVDDKLGSVVYVSPAGPITPLDILYGHGQALMAGHSYMAHKTGFTYSTLGHELQKAGFVAIAGRRRKRELDLWMLATKNSVNAAELKRLAELLLPK